MYFDPAAFFAFAVAGERFNFGAGRPHHAACAPYGAAATDLPAGRNNRHTRRGCSI
jgi:hypothetical protein